MDAGARGYVLKDRPAREPADAVRRVHQGLRVVDPDLAAEAWGEPDPLTGRERQVLRFADDGLSEAISKFGAANRTEAARIARSRGWL